MLRTIQRRKSGTYLDEVIIAVKILIFAAFLVTAAFGIAFHYNIFLNASGKAVVGIAMSCLFFLAIEICKIFFGLHFVHAIFNMVWWKSLYKLLFTLIMGAIVFGAFKWSIHISTKGVASINESLHKGEIFRQSEFATPQSIHDIDAQLEKFENAKVAGSRSTWKGRPTQEGLAIMQSNTDLQKDLVKQRNLLMVAAMARHDSLTNVMRNEVVNTSSTLLEWGGKAEYATMFFLLLLVVAQNIYYDKLEKEQGKKA